MKLFASTLSVLFAATVAASNIIPSVGAAETQIITTEELNSKVVATPASPGYNVEGTSVFTNIVTANNDGQFFFILNGTVVFVKGSGLYWCSDLSFTGVENNSSSSPGYAGRCVRMWLGNTLADILAAGTQNTDNSAQDFTSTMGISAVFVEQLNVFQGQFQKNTDDYVNRYWDDGRPSMPVIGWEGHDEGDLSPNAATSAWSGVSEVIWTSVEDVARLFNTTTDKFTPETFKDDYANAWIKEHEEDAAEKNPNPDAELAIIEQVKNETNGNNVGTGETDEPASTTTNDGNTDTDANNGAAGSPAEDNDDTSTGTRRQLTSTTMRLVSAALRMFGI